MNIALNQALEWRDGKRWKQAVTELCPCIAELLEQTSPSDLLLYTYRDVALRRYYLDRVVLIGDAAHSMSPQLGQGASMALLDAWTLARGVGAKRRRHRRAC